MKKHLFMTLAASLALGMTMSCSDDPDDPGFTPFPDETGNRTVLVYVSAQNSLGTGTQFQKRDSIEMSLGAQYIDDADRFIVYIDDAENPRMYRFTKDRPAPYLVRTFARDANSSDPETLKDVLAWTKQYFPSQEYGLVMWSHSDGWLPAPNKNYRSNRAFGIDTGEGGNMAWDVDVTGQMGASMDIDDMAQAISDAGVHLRFLFFDSCLMQCIESSYALRNVTDYVLASPIPTSGYGTHYTNELRYGFFSEDPIDAARTYFRDVTGGNYADLYGNDGFAFAAVKTSELEDLATLTASLLPQYVRNGAQIDMTGVMAYQPYVKKKYYRPEFYDFGSAMHRILGPADYAVWRRQFDLAVPYMDVSKSYWTGPGAFTYATRDEYYCGVSCFIPDIKYTDNASACLYGDLNEAFRQTEWYQDAGWDETGW